MINFIHWVYLNKLFYIRRENYCLLGRNAVVLTSILSASDFNSPCRHVNCVSIYKASILYQCVIVSSLTQFVTDCIKFKIVEVKVHFSFFSWKNFSFRSAFFSYYSLNFIKICNINILDVLLQIISELIFYFLIKW